MKGDRFGDILKQLINLIASRSLHTLENQFKVWTRTSYGDFEPALVNLSINLSHITLLQKALEVEHPHLAGTNIYIYPHYSLHIAIQSNDCHSLV